MNKRSAILPLMLTFTLAACGGRELPDSCAEGLHLAYESREDGTREGRPVTGAVDALLALSEVDLALDRGRKDGKYDPDYAAEKWNERLEKDKKRSETDKEAYEKRLAQLDGRCEKAVGLLKSL